MVKDTVNAAAMRHNMLGVQVVLTKAAVKDS